MACSAVLSIGRRTFRNASTRPDWPDVLSNPQLVHNPYTHKTTQTSRLASYGTTIYSKRSLHSSGHLLARPKKKTSPAVTQAELGKLAEELTPQPKARRASSKTKKVDTKTKLEQIEELGTSLIGVGASSEPLTAYGGSVSSGKVVSSGSKKLTEREKLLRQAADLEDKAWDQFMHLMGKFAERGGKISAAQGIRKPSKKLDKAVREALRDVETTLQEHVGNTAGGVNAMLNLAALERALRADLTPEDLETARAQRSSSLYSAVSSSLKEFTEGKKARLSPLKPQMPPSWHAAASTPLPNETFLDYEQPITPWDNDGSMMPDLDTALVVTPLKKTHPHKFVIVSIDSQATEADIKKAVAESCDQYEVNIVDVEIFNDVVSNKQRRHAFVSVENAAQLSSVLNDRVRAFGVHINGQRSSIVDVEEKNVISIVTRPPMDGSRIEGLLKDLGVMNLVQKAEAAPTEPLVSSMHLHQSRGNRFSIFAPRDGNGDLIGKAWISFPTHIAAYAAYHSLVACRPGAIRAFWSQKSPNHFEEAIRTRDLLAAENAELKQKLAKTGTDSAPEPAAVDELSLDHVVTTHIRKVLSTVRGDLSQASQILGIKEKTLQTQIKKLRDNGADIPLVENRGKSRLTSSQKTL